MSKSEIQGFDISKKSAAVIGCGGLGCNVAVHLAGSGIGKLYLCDFDTVSESNLNRQFLYSIKDVGFDKAKKAAEKLSGYAPETEIIPVSRKIGSSDDMNFASHCDAVFIATDNIESRRFVSDYCFENSIPFINGAISGFYGSVYLCVPGETPCAECAGILTEQSGNIRSVSSTAGIVGALQAEVGIKYLIGNYSACQGVLHIYDNGEISKLKILSRSACCRCGK